MYFIDGREVMSGKDIRKLPDAEFEIMRAIWQCHEPVTSPILTEKLRITLPEKDWKQQTVMTMLELSIIPSPGMY